MKTFTAITTIVLVAAAASLSDVHAHVYLTQPLAEFKAGASKSSWVAEFQPPWTGSFKTGADYAKVAPGKGFKDLKSFLDSKGPTCGNSLANAKPKPIPSDGMIKLASTIEHAGPCEVWLGSTMAFHNDDCEKAFGSATSFKVDFSSCKGSCLLSFYWLGLQDGGKRWQSYKNYVPLGGGGGGGGSITSTSGGAGGDSTDAKSTNGEEATTKPKKSSNGGSSTKTKALSTDATTKTKAPKSKSKETRSDNDNDEFSFSDLDAWQYNSTESDY